MTFIKLTEEELISFFLVAYEKGRQAKNVCGGLSRLNEAASGKIRGLTYMALLKAVSKETQNDTTLE